MSAGRADDLRAMPCDGALANSSFIREVLRNMTLRFPGFSDHGFGIGPRARQLMADLIAGSLTSVDSKVFDISRLRRRYAAQMSK